MNQNKPTKAISREEEAMIPKFSNGQDAIRYFVSTYKKAFRILDVEQVDPDMKCWFCHLVTDSDVYEEGMERIRVSGFSGLANAEAFMKSHQTINIFSDGHVHVAH